MTVPAGKALGKVGVPEVDDETGIVTWKAAENAVAYRIVKKHDGKTFYGKKTEELSYQMNFNPSRSYEIYIRAFDAMGNYTDGEVLSKAAKVLGTVKDPAVDENGTVTWSAVENAVAYKVGKVVGGKTYYGSKTNDTSYTFNNVPKSDYKVFVVAFDKEGNKTWGTKVDVTLK